MQVIKGKVFKVGDNVNTDYIIPAKYLDLYEPEDLSPHAFEGLGEGYPKILQGHRVVVGGENFGLGSAREQAPNALKGAGIEAIVAKSFARIFYRNTLNVGVAAPVRECMRGFWEKGNAVSRRPTGTLPEEWAAMMRKFTWEVWPW